MKISTITIEPGKGAYIGHIIDAALEMSKTFRCVSMFKFGKVVMCVTEHDNKQELMEYYNERFDQFNNTKDNKDENN